MLNSAPTEVAEWSSAPGKCVYGNVSRVRILPLRHLNKNASLAEAFLFRA